jgi:hypothetical protein
MTIKARALGRLAIGILSAALLTFPQETKSLIQRGDDLYAQRGDLAKAKAAFGKYVDALIANEDPYGAYWRLARVEYWIGDHTAGKAKKRIFEMGIC